MGRLADIENQVADDPVLVFDCVVEFLEDENEDERQAGANK